MSFKKWLLPALALAFGTALMADDEAMTADEKKAAEGQGEQIKIQFDKNVNSQMEDFVKKAGLRKQQRLARRANKQFFFSAVSAPVGKKPTDRDYAAAVNLAYERALLQAKSNIARELAAQVASEAELSITRGQKSDMQTDSTDKLNQMLNAKLTAQLQAQGVDMTDPNAVKAALPEVLNSTEFQSASKTVASTFMIGVAPIRTFVDKNSVGVIAVSSERFRNIALSISDGRPLPQELAVNGDIDDYMESLDPETVATSMGVRLWVDEERQVNILVFTQSDLPSDSASSLNVAKGICRTEAEQYIREFAGQMTAVSAALQKSQSIVELADNLGEMSEVSVKSQDAIRAVGDKLRIAGIQELNTWTVVLPSGHKSLCCAWVWNPELRAAADQAFLKNEAAKAVVDRASANSDRPGAGAAPVARPAEPQYRDQGLKGQGATSGLLY